MPLVVEDGTGLANADAYISVAYANTYFENTNNPAWPPDMSVPEKEAAIRKATNYLDATYEWTGTIASTTQALGWPRIDAEDNEGRDLSGQVPKIVKDACAELAVSALSASLIENTTNVNYVTKEKVGSIEIEYSASAPVTTEYNYVDRLLAPITEGRIGGGDTIKLERV